MPLKSLLYAVVEVLLAFVVGYWIGKSGRRLSATSRSSENVASAEEFKEVDSLFRSLSEITAQVDTQMGRHSMRVDEITSSLGSSNENQSGVIVHAGQLLVDANRKLQTELQEAQQEIERQRQQTNAHRRESLTDILTTLPNRRSFEEHLQAAISEVNRKRAKYALAIIDIDHFKKVNDQHGHMVGDQALKHVAGLLRDSFRENDFIARYGGEEFAVILRNVSLRSALDLTDRVRAAIAACDSSKGGFEFHITVSMGVKDLEPNEEPQNLIARADKALYAAKKAGRNRVWYFEENDVHAFVPTTDDTKAPQTAHSPSAT